MKKKILVGAAVLVVLAAVVLAGVLVVSKYLVGGEKRTRDKWEVETGTYTFTDDEINVQMYRQPVEASIEVAQILPGEYEQEGFTYYNEEVQQRLAQSLMTMMAGGEFTMEAPLAVLNPFGTGSNGLYLYFNTDTNCQIRYTVTTEDESIPAYTATANSAQEFGKVQEFLLIGLVPGLENEVTLEAVNRQGEVKQSFTFTIQMPETTSGHANRLEATEGDSTVEMSEGLFYAMGLSDYYGYTFFFDNNGILRYEMLLDGYHSDRILSLGDQILACVGSNKIARISRIGQVLQVYDLGRFELHHDFNWGPDGELVALATNTEGETVEDQLISINMESGEVTLLVDFSALMNSYFVTTEKVAANSSFFWQAGLWDWLHLNSVQYLAEEDAVMVSSRETSTILKVKNVHEEPAIDWMIGDDAFWEGTEFAQYSLTKEGDSTPQYGQHDVTVIYDDSLPEGQYYLRMFDNNYWANSTRTEYTPSLPDSVGQALTEDESIVSHVYYYLVDENAGTFQLAWSFDVPYSSVVSNVQLLEGGNYVVNSGVPQVYGEYDAEGNLIRQFQYHSMMNGYRVMKDDFAGYWFR
ncbi:MAG: aryl-sulfate sulfotransferase [Fournierella sp.]|uniref:aryl-sulfate sulfotransferase n=1 Tax=Allofournierella sp. TaxID=1940256 RepID=UPI002A7EFA93|nr:aryl-sulfate sulfotransferase [Fournierella sp.]MDY4166484.1 aryl-sulfate sulfotransferase [Fournierella sp.]